jgi:SAM-dependent methyltransferase
MSSDESGFVRPKSLISTVEFWERNARWYKLWLDHNDYHRRIEDVLGALVEPGWSVMDVGSGSGTLSLYLRGCGCWVVAVEPSAAMRALLQDEANRRGVDGVAVDPRRWEDIPSAGLSSFNLVVACNSLHLMKTGFEAALWRLFHGRPHNIFVITESSIPDAEALGRDHGYETLLSESRRTPSSYAYHGVTELLEHFAFKKGAAISDAEWRELSSELSLRDGHLWLEDEAHVHMYWWKRLINTKPPCR